MSDLQFGRVQMRIMRVLWEKKRATAREITETLNEIEPIAHSSVQTLLRTLEQKGAVDHDVDNRTFIFYPLIKNENAKRHALHNFINHIFAGSTEGMVSYIIKNKYMSPEELKKIHKLLEEEEK